MLWIGSKAAAVPTGAPQLSQNDANDALGARHDGQRNFSALVSDFTRHLKTKGNFGRSLESYSTIASGAREYLLIRSVYSGASLASG
jgi:hypothetical protein